MGTPTTNYGLVKPDPGDDGDAAPIADAFDMIDTTMAGSVKDTDYDANSVLIATVDDTPVALVFGASTFFGRKASGGIVALTADEATTILALAAADISDFNAAVRLNTVAQLAAPAAALDMNSNKITGGATPTLSTDFAIKSYVDGLAAAGQQVKAACATSTTANITLSGEQTIDGVLTSASRVLVKDQSTASQNGIYVSAAGAWSRSTDCDAAAEFVNAYVSVTGGTTGAGKGWQQITPATITVGSTSIVWNLYNSLAGTGWADVSKTGTYTAQDREIVLADATGGAFTVTVSKSANVQSIVKKIDASANAVTVASSSGTFDGGPSEDLTSQYEARWSMGDGTNVHVIGERVPFGAPVALGGPPADGDSARKARANHVHGTRTLRNVITTDYSIQASDEGKAVEHNSASAHTITVTSQTDGVEMEVYAAGAGQITLVGDTGITLRAPNGAKSAHQYASIGLRWRATNEVVVRGDTTT